MKEKEKAEEFDVGKIGEGTDATRWSLVTDDAVVADFNDPSKYIETYRTFQVVDGKLYSPTAAKTPVQVRVKNGKMRTVYQWTDPVELGKVYKADERPDTAHEKDGKWYVTLNKGNGSSLNDIAYK